MVTFIFVSALLSSFILQDVLCLVFLNPLKCFTTNGITRCFVTNLDDANNSTYDSIRAMIPSNTHTLTIQCTTQSKNSFSMATFSLLQNRVQNLIFWDCLFPFIPTEGLNRLASLESLEFHSRFGRVKDKNGGKLYDRYGYILPYLLERQNFSSELMCSLRSLKHLAFTNYGIRNVSQTLSCSKPTCCSQLSSLNFSANFISHIYRGAFTGLENLKILDLSRNNISTLPMEEVSKLKLLTTLTLTGNPLHQLPVGIFQHNLALTQLDIGNHEPLPESVSARVAISPAFTILDTGKFEFPKSLTSLSLNAVNSTSIDNRFHMSLLNIRKLSVAYPISYHFTKAFAGFPFFLKVVLLRMIYLTDLTLQYKGPIYPRMFAEIKNLTTLTLKCRASLDDVLSYSTFFGLQKLRVLNIESSKWKNNSKNIIEGSSFFRVFPNIKSLNLKGFSLEFLSDTAFIGLKSLNVLGLRSCGLETIPYGICNRASAVNLLEIYLNENSIDHLRQDDFHGCTNLNAIDLSHNYLEMICGEQAKNCSKANYNPFSSLVNLMSLILSHNRIRYFDLSMISQSLLHLDLSNNLLVDLTDKLNMRHTLQLRTLWLHQNRLYSVRENIFPPLLRELYVGNNEFKLTQEQEYYGPMPLHIETNAFSDLKSLQLVIIDHLRNFTVMRKSFSNCPSFTGAFFHIKWIDRGLCPEELSQDWYPVQEQDCSIFTRNTNDFKVISYYNNQRRRHHYCQYKQECGHEWYSSQCLMCDKCDKLKLWKLATLDCGEARFEEFPSNFPFELGINHLHLDGNHIKRIPNYAFAKLQSSLKVLYLNDSHISVIDMYAFGYLSKIRELHLENNDITSVSSCLFPVASTVRRLYLQNNRLTDFPFYSGSVRWYNATEVNLANNEISVLDKRVLWSFVNLQTISLRNNSIKEITMLVTDEYSPILKRLDLSHNMISTIEPFSFHKLYTLTFLNLEHNKLRRLNQFEFHGLRELLYLQLNNNHMEKIASRIFHSLPKLQILYLDDNALTDFTINVQDLSELLNLSLANNRLRVLNNTFKGLKRLEDLDLSGNEITTLDQGLLTHLQNLKRLCLNRNQIQSIYSAFRNLFHLNELQLSHNALSTVHTELFEDLHSLAILYLDNNSFANPPVWQFPKSIKTLRLSNNPLTCDCDFMKEFKKWLEEKGSVKLQDAALLTCDDSSNGEKIRIQEYDVNSLCHKSYELALGTCTGLIFILFMGLCGLYYWRLEVQVWVYSRYGKRLFYNCEDEDQKPFDVFIAYATEDENMVINELVPGLKDYRVCVHYQHFMAGAYITDAIMEAVENSSRTLLVFSPRFVLSPWCKFEFKMAHHKALQDRCCRLILILLEDVDGYEMDPEQRAYIRTNTYLRYDDSFFWEKLRFALPNLRPNAPPLEGSKALIDAGKFT